MTGILLLDKESGMSSQKAVHKVRSLTGVSKAGHGGTLDPMACGLLPILLGSATKLSDFLLTGDKGYIAGLRFGFVTDTLDVTGQVLRSSDLRPKREQLEALLPRFTGELLQTPPMYSAISQGGQKLYKLARQGIEVERAPRRVNIRSLRLLEFSGEKALLEVECSKGTYVRSLVFDLGEALGCGACMSSLRRTMSAGFRVEQAHTLAQVEAAVQQDRLRELVLSPETLFEELPELEFPAFYQKLLFDGQRVLQRKLGSSLPTGAMARWKRDGAFAGLLRETQTSEGSALCVVWRETNE